MTSPFVTPPPRVRLLKAFSNPLQNAVAAARTCYSSRGVVGEDEVAESGREKYMALAKSVFGAGHHTVFQHSHFQFAIENVSRQFLWSFLHAHPFYNSEQVSQRYVAVREGNATVPRLEDAGAQAIYERCLRGQFTDYQNLCNALMPVVAEEYHRRFLPSASQAKRHAQAIQKKAQEVARYVLPVATQAYLVHTVSGLTALRYHKLSRQLDTPTESQWVAGRMLEEIAAVDPDFAALAGQPLDEDQMPEWQAIRRMSDLFSAEERFHNENQALRFLEEFERDFRKPGPRARDGAGAGETKPPRPDPREVRADLFPDALLEAMGWTEEDLANASTSAAAAGGKPGSRREFHNSKLVAYARNAETLLAKAVRQVLGLPAASLSDSEAIALALDPARNRLLGETLNVTTLNKVTRALLHPHYTFLKKISHTADSQDQRHRMVPGSRPFLVAHLTGHPDYMTPLIVERDARALRIYRESMSRTWEAIRALRSRGVEDEWAAYLLPNAVVVRFMDSGDLLNLRHKHEMRLCYNSQEEIWRASLEEAIQISRVHPRIGRFLLPPCTLRQRAGAKPYCPEGPRYCGVRVWTLEREEYERVI